jgi:hypothetical protein
MNPLETLRNQTGIDGAFVDTIINKMQETGQSLESALLTSGMSPTEVRDFFAQYFQIPSFDIPEGFTVTQQVLNFIPEDSAAHYRMVPLVIEDEVLVVGVNNPDDLKILT